MAKLKLTNPILVAKGRTGSEARELRGLSLREVAVLISNQSGVVSQ